MLCNKCGKDNIENANLCINCGNNLNVSNQPSFSSTQTQAQSSPSPFFGQPEIQSISAQQLNNNLKPSAAGKINKKLNIKSLTVPAIVIALILLAIGAYLLFFSGNVPAGQIRPLSVDLEKVTFKCGDGKCTELNSKILSINGYDSKINSKSVDRIALTSDGVIYALYKDEAIKIDGGDIKIKSIDAVIDNEESGNPLIQVGDNYYEITTEAKIKQIETGFSKDVKLVVNYSSTKELMLAIGKDSKLALYYSCKKYSSEFGSDQCKKDTDWIKMMPKESSYLNKTVKYAITAGFVNEDNKLYPLQIFTSGNIKTMQFQNATNQDSPDPILEKVSGTWGWADGNSSTGFMVAQTENNFAYFVELGGWSNDDYKYKYELTEKISDAYFNDKTCFIIKTNSKIYLALYGYDENLKKVEGLKEYPELTKYKDNVRGLYHNQYSFYMLLSDGNLYEFYNNAPAYARDRK